MTLLPCMNIAHTITDDPQAMEADDTYLGGVSIKLYQIPIATVHGNGDADAVYW